MTDMKKPKKVRLYLDREGQTEIYIETSFLPQHQIDGIRFLYRQFKKKKPGVILNNPEGYGKSIQVVLFLDAVRKLLTNPVLILCEDDNKVNSWKQTLIKWTKYTEEDIVVDSANIYVKKTIFLKQGTDLVPPYSRRDWGVVVVKSNFALKQLVKTPIKATFKIWLTTMDMRKDLELFNSIYSWLYSEKKFDVMKYITSISKVNEPLVPSKLLTAFMDDVVIMRNNFTPLRNSEVIQEKPSNTSHKSRKNKDATGTKIKRSKKTIESDTANILDLNTFNNTDHTYVESTANSNPAATIMNPDNESDINEDMDYDTVNANEDLDVESFIIQKEPVHCEEYDFLNESNSTDTENMSFTEALNDIVENENDANGGDTEQSSEGLISNIDDEVLFLSDTDEQICTNVNSNGKNGKDKHKKKSLPTPVSPKSVRTNGTVSDKTDKCIDQKMADVITDKTLKNKNNRRDIIEALSEMEEQAMKKFKGSLLDSFF